MNSLLSAKRIAECLVGSSTHPVLGLLVDSPETNRIARVCHIALTDTSLLLAWNHFHIAIDDVAIVVGQLLALSFCDFV